MRFLVDPKDETPMRPAIAERCRATGAERAFFRCELLWVALEFEQQRGKTWDEACVITPWRAMTRSTFLWDRTIQAGTPCIGVAVGSTACGFVDGGDEVPRVPEIFGSSAGTTLQLCLIRRRVIATNEELRDRDAECAGDLLQGKGGGIALGALDA